MTAVAGAALGVVVGLILGLLVHLQRQARLASVAHTAGARLADAHEASDRLTAQLERTSAALSEAQAEQGRLTAEVELLGRNAEAQARAWEDDRARLSGAFAELSAQALQQNAEQFLTLADARLKEAQESARGDLAQRQQAISQVLAPLEETLQKYERGLRQLELERKGAYAGLVEQVRQIGVSHEQLQKETRSLVTALRSPQTRGRWGEMQLRRVVEMAGMLAHCDFEEQVSTESDDGRRRPDVVVHLPGGAQVVVDAKVPLDAFLKSTEAEDDASRTMHLVAHGRQLRTHVDQLAKKQYWSQFDPSPEFVVAFVPGDPLLAAAFEHDPTLIEHAMASRVLLTTPTTLIALLRTVAYSWQQEALADNARVVQRLGSELYDRLRVMGGHLGKLHRSLTGTVEAFNETVGSLESRVLVTARRFPELGVVGDGGPELAELRRVAALPRRVQAPELVPGAEGFELDEAELPLAALHGLAPRRGHLPGPDEESAGGLTGTGGSR